MKSNWISNVQTPCGIGEVVSPREVTYSVTCQEWFVHGVRVRRILPTICVHMCSVAAVSIHSAKGKDGQNFSRSSLVIFIGNVAKCTCAVRSHLINIVTRQISIVGDKMEALASRARMEGRAPSRPYGKQDATEGVPPFQHNHFYKHNGKCCSRGYNATYGLAEQTVLTDSIAVNEIGKRTPHPLEHATRL